MRNINFIGSITKDSNKLYSSTETHGLNVKENALIKIGPKDIYFSINKLNKITIIKDFEIINNKTIKVNNINEYCIFAGDIINLTYDEFELLTVFSIDNAGDSYQIGDILFADGGNPSLDITENKKQICSFTVSEIHSNGGIKTLQIKSRGKYIQTPEKTIKLTGGHGKNSEITVDYKPCDSQSKIERRVSKTEIDKNILFIHLDYPIFNNISKGKLFCEKHEIIIQNNSFESLIGAVCEIIMDFTPYCSFPLLQTNQKDIIPLLNEIIKKMDKEIFDLKESIKKS